MNFLIDANVLSEVRRPAPEPKVLEWLDRVDEDRAYVSVVSIAEIRRGIALMEAGRRRDALSEWLEHDLPERFERRTLHIDEGIALQWGDLMAASRRAGRGLSTMDGFLAATALARGLTLVTRNTNDFASLGIDLLNPWPA